MVSIKDKFLSSHRSQVRSSLWGKLNIYYSVMLFNGLDLLVLCIFWHSYYLAATQLKCTAMLPDMLVNTALCFLPLVSLIPNEYLFYLAFALYLVKFWHICHMAGRMSGLLVFNSVRVSRGLQIKLMHYYGKLLQPHLRGYFLGTIRLILIILSVWYTLVLQRIRTAGGTGREKKSAEEFELELIRNYRESADTENYYTEDHEEEYDEEEEEIVDNKV